jgi:hypothetical protein
MISLRPTRLPLAACPNRTGAHLHQAHTNATHAHTHMHARTHARTLTHAPRPTTSVTSPSGAGREYMNEMPYMWQLLTGEDGHQK